MKMSEPEVAIRLAIHLISSGRAASTVSVAIDGAQVKIGQVVNFELVAFLHSLGWTSQTPSDRWQGTYRSEHHANAISVHSRSGFGDVVADLVDGSTLLVEAKKGPLGKSKSSQEYPLMREAIGQLMTLESVPPRSILAVAVPHGDRFVALAERWRNAPMILQSKIKILTVSSNGDVSGW